MGEEETVRPVCRFCGAIDDTISELSKDGNLQLCYECIRLKIEKLTETLNKTLNEEQKELLGQLLSARDYMSSHSIMMS